MQHQHHLLWTITFMLHLYKQLRVQGFSQKQVSASYLVYPFILSLLCGLVRTCLSGCITVDAACAEDVFGEQAAVDAVPNRRKGPDA